MEYEYIGHLLPSNHAGSVFPKAIWLLIDTKIN
jgi:hypothetical protein